jgi:hypothetical protein
MSARELAKKLSLTEPRAFALRRRLKIDEDQKSRHDFRFGKSTFPGYSDNAYTNMKAALADLDMAEVWKEYGPGRTPKKDAG